MRFYPTIALLATLLAMFATSCQTMPEPYAPPVQRQPFEDARAHRIARIVSMADSDAPAHFVRDIPPGEPAAWKWTNQNPAVKLLLKTNQNLRYVIDFTVPEVTFKQTGPVALTFSVNGHVLDTVRYAAYGEYHFEKSVPPEWVDTQKEAIVEASIDKVFVAPGDGAKLGFILTRIGLTQ